VTVDQNVSCNGGANGGLTANPSGGTSPYAYLWSNAGTNASISGLTANSYSVTITDANGCTALASNTVTQPAVLSATVTLDSNVSCAGGSDGGLTANASGGTSAYSYLWSNSSTTASINGLTAGTYTVTITDANACTAIASSSIVEVDTIAPQVVAQNIVVYLDQNGNSLISGQDLDAGSTDNCAVDTLFTSPVNSYNCTNVGPNAIQLIAVDNSGNRDTVPATVVVFDTLAPLITTNNLVLVLDSTKVSSITASSIDNGTIDNCSLDSIWIAQSEFNCTEVGVNNVWFYAMDVNGNLDSAQFTVTVADTLDPDTIVTIASACGSYFWTQNAQTYGMSGNYLDTLPNRFGCDSIIYNLDLSIDTVSFFTDVQIACDSLVWIDGITYFTNNNTATDTLMAANGCDSIVSLDLTIENSYQINEADSACFSYTWAVNNKTYNNSGFYTEIFNAANGCDSVINLDLEIRPLDLSVINVGDSLFAFQANATYQWYDCRGDSLISGVNSRGYRPDTSGFYSIIIDNGICSDTTACQEVIVIGVEEKSLASKRFNIYPNPTQEDFTIEIENLDMNEIMMVYDIKGKILMQERIETSRQKIETKGWSAGMYFVRYGDQIKKLVITR
jgi:hypothetical protein